MVQRQIVIRRLDRETSLGWSRDSGRQLIRTQRAQRGHREHREEPSLVDILLPPQLAMYGLDRVKIRSVVSVPPLSPLCYPLVVKSSAQSVAPR